MDLLSFIHLLVEELIQDPNVQDVAPEKAHPRLVPTFFQHYAEYITEKGAKKQRACKVCFKRAQINVAKRLRRSIWRCDRCKVILCVEKCF